MKNLEEVALKLGLTPSNNWHPENTAKTVQEFFDCANGCMYGIKKNETETFCPICGESEYNSPDSRLDEMLEILNKE